MPKYVIEREIPNVGKMSIAELKAASQKSCGVIRKIGPELAWLESFVTDDKLYCVYISPSEQAIKDHAAQSGFPASRISQVRAIIDPTTSE